MSTIAVALSFTLSIAISFTLMMKRVGWTILTLTALGSLYALRLGQPPEPYFDEVYNVRAARAVLGEGNPPRG